MRLLIKSLTVVVIVTGVGSYSSYLLTGLWPWQTINLPSISDLSASGEALLDQVEQITPDLTVPASDSTTTVYKWRDKEGVWHYSNTEPPQHSNAETLHLETNVNVLPASETPATTSDSSQMIKTPATAAKSDQKPTEDNSQPSLYSSEGIQKLMQDARNVQELMNNRAAEQQQAIDQM